MKKLQAGMLALALSAMAGSSANAATILVFGQTDTPNGVTATAAGGATSINSNNLAVTITAIEGGGPDINAFLTLDLDSVGAAFVVGGNGIGQIYSGTFAITNGAVNYLSGTIGGALALGLSGGTSLTIASAQPPAGLTFTENTPLITSLDVPRSLSLSFTNVTPGLQIVGGTIGSFTATVSGDASATPATVPEPATLMVLGAGLIGAAFRARRRS